MEQLLKSLFVSVSNIAFLNTPFRGGVFLLYYKSMLYDLLNLLDLFTTGTLVIVIIVMAYQRYVGNARGKENDFVAIASHQLRTPLTIMRGYISMILGGDFGPVADKRQKAAMTAVYQANERLLRLVDNLLGVSQLESREAIKIECKEFDVISLVKKIMEEMKQKAAVKGIELKLSLPKKVPLVCVDDLMLRQVILNVLDNAIKYTDRGEVEFSVEVYDKSLRFVTSDTGPGIDQKNLEAIFQKFERREVPNNNQQGFGLGLYASRLIVEAHKGKIWAETRGKDFGFRVSFEIPRN